MIPLTEVDTMTDAEYRHVVATALNRIEVSLNGVEGDEANGGLRGLCGVLARKIEYEESQRKTDILPRLAQHNARMVDIEHEHQMHLVKQVGRSAGKQQAFNLAMAVLGGAGVMFGILG